MLHLKHPGKQRTGREETVEHQGSSGSKEKLVIIFGEERVGPRSHYSTITTIINRRNMSEGRGEDQLSNFLKIPITSIWNFNRRDRHHSKCEGGLKTGNGHFTPSLAFKVTLALQ